MSVLRSRQPGMGLGTVISETFRLYRANLGVFLGITAIIYIPYILLTAPPMGLAQSIYRQAIASMVGPPGSPPSLSLPWAEFGLIALAGLGVWVLSNLFIPLIYGATTIAVAERYLGRHASVVDSYHGLRPNWWKYPVTGLMVGIATSLAGILGLPLCLVGGPVLMILFTVWFMLTAPVITLEGRWGVNAMARSGALVAGQWWSVFAVYLVFWALMSFAIGFVAAPVAMLAAEPSGPPPPLGLFVAQQAVGGLVGMLLFPLLAIATTLVYFDMRMQKEGFNLAVLADDLSGAYDPSAVWQKGDRSEGGPPAQDSGPAVPSSSTAEEPGDGTTRPEEPR